MKHEAWKSTGNCVYETWYHVVWSTKYRRKVLIAPVDVAAKDLLQEICAKHGYEVKGLEVMPDPIHLFISVPPAEAVATAVKVVKGASARMLFVRFPHLKKRLWGGHLWNPSYYVGTAGHVSSETIQRYIERQKEAAEEQ
jgi:putative transposase